MLVVRSDRVKSAGSRLALDTSYRIPGLKGLYCSIGCVEALLFGEQHCRWCGRDMDKPYNEIGSRLCSRNCELNYKAHVFGDRSAALGSGRRLLLWLQREQPAAYRRLAGASSPGREILRESGLQTRRGRATCKFDSPPKGKQILLHGLPGPSAQGREVLTGDFAPPRSPCLSGFSRNKPAGSKFPPPPTNLGVSRNRNGLSSRSSTSESCFCEWALS